MVIYERTTKPQKKLAKDSATFQEFVKEYRIQFPESKRNEKALMSIYYREKGTKNKRKTTKPAVTLNKTGGIKHNIPQTQKDLDPQELEFLKTSKSSNELCVKYFKHFGLEKKSVTSLQDIWKRRVEIIEYARMKAIRPAIPVKTEPITQRLRASMVDEDQVMVNMSHSLADIRQYNKEMAASLAEIQKAQAFIYDMLSKKKSGATSVTPQKPSHTTPNVGS
jgi:hypothetical protein